MVIGKHANYVGEADALDYVAGYCVINDVSEREWQLERGGTGTRARAATRSARSARGSSRATKSPIRRTSRCGSTWTVSDQNGSTKTMVFGVRKLVSYVSHFMSLHPGDVISTGTPPGVGSGKKPQPIFLRPGQTIRLGIEGLGEQTQRTIAA